MQRIKILDKAEYNYKGELNPNYAEAYNNLGITLKDLEKYEVIINLEKAIELNQIGEAYNNLGITLKDLN